MRRFAFLVFVALAPGAASGDVAPYAGQEDRAIKALAPERIDGLRAGAGLGFAKAAELNGWPGPLHALELSAALGLSAEQAREIEAIRARMLAAAKPLGAALIEAEAALDGLFAEGRPDGAAILEATARIGAIEAELRAVHLEAHIETAPLLSRHQRMIYAEARGYGAGADGGHSGHGAH